MGKSVYPACITYCAEVAMTVAAIQQLTNPAPVTNVSKYSLVFLRFYAGEMGIML